MSQQSGQAAAIDHGATLDKRLMDLDTVDRKIAEVMDITKEIISNLEKDKQISKTKMDESVKRFTTALENDVFKVISEQLNYMENLCVGSEHQGSMFQTQSRREISKRSLQLMHKELETLVQPKEMEKEGQLLADPDLSEEDNESSFEDVISVASSESR